MRHPVQRSTPELGGKLFGLLLVTFCVCEVAYAGSTPKGIGEMTPQEVRDEVHRLYKDDLPYATYIKGITSIADAAWPKLNDAERIGYEVNVYARLMDAERLLIGVTALPADAAGRRYQAAVSISLAMDGEKLGPKYPQFYADVFASPEFNASSSAFRGAVTDLWKRYAAAKKDVPYTELLLLNQAKMGTPDGQDGDPLWVAIATLYAGVGDHQAEAEWYGRVSPAFLGPVRAADALFAAGQFNAAAERYRAVLEDLGQWAKIKPTLAGHQLYEPLQSADLGAIKARATAREAECRARAKPRAAATTKPA